MSILKPWYRWYRKRRARELWTPAARSADGALWLRGDLGVTLNGSDASAWECQFNGTTFVQATALDQPAVVTSAPLNGRTALDFDGANHFMDVASGALLGNVDASTWHWVIDNDSVTGHLFRNGSNALYAQRAGTKVGFYDATAVRETTYSGTTTAQCMTIVIKPSTSKAHFYRDGVDVAGSPVDYDDTFGLNAAATLTLGAFTGGGSGRMNCRLAEVFGFRNEDNATQLSEAWAYISARYGL